MVRAIGVSAREDHRRAFGSNQQGSNPVIKPAAIDTVAQNTTTRPSILISTTRSWRSLIRRGDASSTCCGGNQSTEVEVLFEPTITGTRVTVRHRGWSAIRPGHPVQHGVEGAAFSRMIGLCYRHA
jgi:hypothetical protein